MVTEQPINDLTSGNRTINQSSTVIVKQQPINELTPGNKKYKRFKNLSIK
jgi:hypothetical protein